MNFNQQLAEAYQQGRRQALNEQGMMSNMNATSFPQDGGGLVGGGNQYPSMMSNNNSGTAVPNYQSGRGPIGPRTVLGDPLVNPTTQTLQNIMMNWGPVPKDLLPWQQYASGDLNMDGVIDGQDLAIELGNMSGETGDG
tara:strand:- start:3089 stop:3505 length:417 start_codon:yes stop_codon:yes gene_type:complete